MDIVVEVVFGILARPLTSAVIQRVQIVDFALRNVRYVEMNPRIISCCYKRDDRY